MTHILLIFSVLLCFGHLAQALVCDVCENYELEGKLAGSCLKGKGTCVAEPGQKCIHVRAEGSSVRRCSVPGDVCDRAVYKGGWMSTFCCDHADHCLYQK